MTETLKDETEGTGGPSALSAGLGKPCLICKKPVPDFVAEICCSGYECGCGGQSDWLDADDLEIESFGVL